MFVDFCGSKKRYSSQSEARRTLSVLRHRKTEYDSAHIYFCARCKTYHIGHKS